MPLKIYHGPGKIASVGAGLSAGAGFLTGWQAGEDKDTEDKRLADEAKRRNDEWEKKKKLYDLQQQDAQMRLDAQQKALSGNEAVNSLMIEGMQVLEQYRAGQFGDTPEDKAMAEKFLGSLDQTPKEYGAAGEVMAAGFWAKTLSRLSPAQRAVLSQADNQDFMRLAQTFHEQLEGVEDQRLRQEVSRRAEQMQADGVQFDISNETTAKGAMANLDQAQQKFDHAQALAATRDELVKHYTSAIAEKQEEIASYDVNEKLAQNKLLVALAKADTEQEMKAAQLELELLIDPKSATARILMLEQQIAELRQSRKDEEIQQRSGSMWKEGMDARFKRGFSVSGQPPPATQTLPAPASGQPPPKQEIEAPSSTEKRTFGSMQQEERSRALAGIQQAIKSGGNSKEEQLAALNKYLEENGIEWSAEIEAALREIWSKPRPESRMPPIIHNEQPGWARD